MMMKSLVRIVFDPGGASELVILDWDQLGEVGALQWQQVVQTDQIVAADWASIIARGNASRTWSITARTLVTDPMELQYEALDHDADFPLGVTAALHVRVLDMTEAATGTEAERTLAHYIAANATIASAVPRPVPEDNALEVAYQIALGALVRQ